MLAKNWKALAVLGVLVWSLLNLFQIVPEEQLKYYQHLASLTPPQLQLDVNERLRKDPEWDKLNAFQREERQKTLLEEAQFANNLQVLGHFDKYAVITNLKLGLDLRGGSQLLLQAKPTKLVP